MPELYLKRLDDYCYNYTPIISKTGRRCRIIEDGKVVLDRVEIVRMKRRWLLPNKEITEWVNADEVVEREKVIY